MQRRLPLLCLGCGGCHIGTVLYDEPSEIQMTLPQCVMQRSQPIFDLGCHLCYIRLRTIWISLGFGA